MIISISQTCPALCTEGLLAPTPCSPFHRYPQRSFSDDSYDSQESEVDDEIADLANLLAMNIEVGGFVGG